MHLPVTCGSLPLSFLTSDSVAGSAVEAFVRGGVVMWPLLLCSLVATAIALERLVRFGREQANNRRDRDALEQIMALAAAGKYDDASTVAGAAHGATGRVIAAGLRHRDYGLSDSLAAAANAELDLLRAGLSILDTIITVAPLLGILGTVTGIIRSFNLLSSGGIEEPAAVTGGIAEALITTAAGLIVAICALIPFNYLVARVRRTARDLEQTTHLFEVAYSRGQSHAPGNRI